MRMLGALPENELYWRTAKGAVSYPTWPGSASEPLRVLPTALQAKTPAPYPALPVVGDFPLEIRQPFLTLNLGWYALGAVANVGKPTAINDWREFLRSAIVDSDWNRVEQFVSWYLTTQATTLAAQQSFLSGFNFGMYKWTLDANGQKKYWPFSPIDFETFFARFRRFESGKAADQSCIEKARKAHTTNYPAKLAQVSNNVPMLLTIGSCPLDRSFVENLTRVVVVTGAFIAAAYAAGTVLPAAGGAGGSTGLAAGAGASAGGSVGSGLSAWSNTAFSAVGSGTAATATAKTTILAALKKLAISQGIDYALNYAAQKYAESEQKEMTREMQAELETELKAAQAEYAALVAGGVSPTVAAGKASADSVKVGALVVAGAAILALLAFGKTRR